MSYDPEQITFFAKTDARGQSVPFGIKAKDRTRHVYVIGKTGMGKSTLLENMAVQDMKNGNGLAFIDPHGATAETLLNYVPEERVDDVLYFAPFDTSNPIAFNVMEDVGPERRHLVAAGLMSVFKKIWVDAWSARMEYILQNTILALLEYPESTLLGVNRMLSDKHYRQKVIDNISDPAVKSFWVDEFLNYNERYMQEAGDAIKNKIGQFTANPLIRNIIGQPHTSFDIRKMMDEKKILIANLSKGLIGESNANLLGSMLTTRIYLAAMSRADLPPQEMKQMPNFYFYVDEFQSFANATFADILSEARKYHLNLTIAHQYIEQMEEEVRNAVFGNVGTIISFRVGPFDAETLETIYAPQFYAVDICNLGFAQIYLTLMIDGIGSRPFSATTLPPIEMPSVSCRNMVIARSQDNFSSQRIAVEEKINGWMAESFEPPKPLREKSKGNAPASSGNGPLKKTIHNNQPTQARAAVKPETPDLNQLRDVLKNLSNQSNETTGKAAKSTSVDSGASSKLTTTNKTEKKSEKPTNDKKQQHNVVEKKEASQKLRSEAPNAMPLKEALAAVLAERTHTPNETKKFEADRTKATKNGGTEKSKQSTKNTAPATPKAQQSTPQHSQYQEAKSKDAVDPKQIERMLRLTGADNSPLKKR